MSYEELSKHSDVQDIFVQSTAAPNKVETKSKKYFMTF